MTRRTGAPGSRRHAGFTYIGLLILVAAMGLALTVVAQLWHTAQTRDKEEELLFVGNEIRRAIGLYITSTGRYPHNLEDLLKDPGFPGVRRSLRKLYRDPITDEPCVPDSPELPLALDKVYPLNEIVRVDYSLPGCPPSADAIWKFLTDLILGRMPRLDPSLLHYD